MERINVYENLDYEYHAERIYKGWFDFEKAKKIASVKQGSPYTTGKTLYVTTKGKMVINDWTNYDGKDTWRFAESEEEIVEMLVACGYDEEKYKEIIDAYEV